MTGSPPEPELMVCSQSPIGIEIDDVLSVDMGDRPVANPGHDHVFVPDLRGSVM